MNLLKRYFIFFAGLFLMGLGIALITKADIGTSPISSVPYVLSLKFPLSFGMFTFVICILFVLLQAVLLRGRMPLRDYLQIAVGLIFGYFVDAGMAVLSHASFPDYWEKIIALVAGCFMLAIGVNVQIAAGTVLNPAEGIVKVLADRTKAEFGNVKMIFDWSLVAIALLLSLLAFGSMQGLREGTVISALLVGQFVKLVRRIMVNVSSKRLAAREGYKLNEGL
ncbi:YczE/YyaS/YitT family protein [Gorillibacterium massiliense]|uniref:YczE/YyaS/YitT family protein n=1 Tax=Gorillibacterium massiliense TaxID=1280390 RepID=UPI000693E2AD|nr:DUF6198 family protein [Gorillibacterium massiliense]